MHAETKGTVADVRYAWGLNDDSTQKLCLYED